MSESKPLGFWRTWSMSVGTMIGSGIFMMPAVLAPYGGIGLTAWIVSGVAAIIFALTFAGLARRIQKPGGCYAYSHEALGDFGGFIAAWGYWISVWIAMASLCVAFVSYMSFFIPVLGDNPMLGAGSGLIMLWVLIGLNLTGMKGAGTFQLITTILKLAPLVIVSLIGLVIINPISNFQPFNPSGESMVTALGAASILTVWAFMGLEAATIPAEDVVDPTNTIPKALIFGTISVGIVYFASTYAVFGIVPRDELLTSASPFADAAVILVGQWGGIALGIGAIISIVGSLNSNIICGAYTSMAAARDNLMPKNLSKMNKNNVPQYSIILVGVLGSVTMLFNFSKGLVGAYVFMLLVSTLSTLLAYALSSISALIIEIRDPKMAGNEKSRHLAIAFLAFLFSVGMIAAAGPEPVYWGFLLILAGLPVYVLASRNKRKSDS